ncbi:transposase (plasmid) [Rhizobium sp. CCGE 510]|nr:hypothetical protein [Rhizobium sp. CCGE 510]EJT01301.1 transposase [Rhizobium sp. CCGE 510]
MPHAQALFLYAVVREFLSAIIQAERKHRDGAKVIKRYHRPAQPYQRLLDDARTPEDTCLWLKAMYLTLDPVRLLRDIRLAQERLVEIADKPDGSPATDGEALPLEDFLSGLRIAWRGGEVKPTARSMPAAKRERRKPDPLLAVTAELEEWFKAEPWRTSRELLERLQVKYPGVYPDGLIRTVQRRMKIWRSTQANALVFGPFADAARQTEIIEVVQ